MALGIGRIKDVRTGQAGHKEGRVGSPLKTKILLMTHEYTHSHYIEDILSHHPAFEHHSSSAVLLPVLKDPPQGLCICCSLFLLFPSHLHASIPTEADFMF